MKQERKQIVNTDAYSLEIDIAKNRVYFCIRGHWDKNTLLTNYLLDWKEAISYLQPNFTIISDTLTMLPHAVSVEKLHEETQKYLIDNGLFKVAEIMPINDIANLQANRITERSQLPVIKLSSLEEAEECLDKLVEEMQNSLNH
ncbi:hypothetical protein V9L05_18555 [Bernardetia sp. Wsw4-3y2]|uniref:hypothetical protein n=1 Tax=unclassified Bernardetia TaxID=2647129 RepID=UPI0030CC410B